MPTQYRYPSLRPCAKARARITWPRTVVGDDESRAANPHGTAASRIVRKIANVMGLSG